MQRFKIRCKHRYFPKPTPPKLLNTHGLSEYENQQLKAITYGQKPDYSLNNQHLKNTIIK